MGTSWSEIITNYASLFIDDARFSDDLAVDPALYFRRMSLYMTAAIPMLSSPPQLLEKVTNGLESPTYADAEWTSDAGSMTGETNVDTGNTGYGMFSCILREVSPSGEVTLTPYEEAIYDENTGIVTFPTQTAENVQYQMDFYKDGTFAFDLTTWQKRLLGLAFAIVWDERFSRNWLNIQMKIKDASFETVNESNYMNAVQNRLSANHALFNDELHKYEQTVAYANVMPYNGSKKRFV